MKISSWITPGICGIALWLPALFCKCKGYKTIGFRTVDLPSIWISLHPGLTDKADNAIHVYCEKICISFTEKILF